MKVRVLENLWVLHNGGKYETGQTFEAEDAQVASLVEAGAVERVVDEDKSTDSKSEADGQVSLKAVPKKAR